MRRLQAAQSAVKPLRAEVDRLYLEMGKLAFLVYAQGAITQPELIPIGERLAEAQARIQAAEAEVERIRAEEYMETLGGSTQTRLVCPSGHGPLVVGASFCQVCGAGGVLPALPAPSVAVVPCRNCGAAVDSTARFCASCGAEIERCGNCGVVLPSDALFCAECGTPVNKLGASDPLDWPDEPQ